MGLADKMRSSASTFNASSDARHTLPAGAARERDPSAHPSRANGGVSGARPSLSPWTTTKRLAHETRRCRSHGGSDREPFAWSIRSEFVTKRQRAGREDR